MQSSQKMENCILGEKNQYGCLGHGDLVDVDIHTPKKIEYFAKNGIHIKDVALGNYHTIALSTEGKVYTFGCGKEVKAISMFTNDVGAIGHGSLKASLVPKEIITIPEKVISVKAGASHSIVLTESKNIYMWGRGEYGTLGNKSTKSTLLPILEKCSQELKTDDPEDFTPASIDSARNYSGYLTTSGKMLLWGKNEEGQIGLEEGSAVEMTDCKTEPTEVEFDEKFIDCALGYNTMLLLTEKGKILKSGMKMNYVPAEFATVNKKVKLLCGSNYYGFISEDGILETQGWFAYHRKAYDNKSQHNIINLSDMVKGKIKDVSGKYTTFGMLAEK